MPDNERKKPLYTWLRCPACYLRYFTFRAKLKSYQCRHCGATFQADWEKQITTLVQMPIFEPKRKG